VKVENYGLGHEHITALANAEGVPVASAYRQLFKKIQEREQRRLQKSARIDDEVPSQDFRYMIAIINTMDELLAVQGNAKQFYENLEQKKETAS